jgi:NADH-quinone oxidoreductase subunit J
MTQELVFLAFASLIALCSVMVILSRNAVVSAIYLVGDLFSLAGLYASMDAHFVAAIQVLVYAGAIVVLFMFVIMLLNLGPDQRQHLQVSAPEVGVLALTIVAFLIVGGLLLFGQPTGVTGPLTAEAIDNAGGNTYTVGMVLFTKYLWPFELASMLILLAIIAAIVIAKKEHSKDGDTRRLAHG